MKNSIWIWVHHKEGTIDEITSGLIREAVNTAQHIEGTVSIVAVAVGDHLTEPLNMLGTCGVDRVIQLTGTLTSRYHGEYYAEILSKHMATENPLFFFMGHEADTADLAPRLAAVLKSNLVTRVVDLKINDKEHVTAIRPTANGYLFEEVTCQNDAPLILTFLPQGLVPCGESVKNKNFILDRIDLPDDTGKNLQTEIVEIIEAAPENLDISDADILVAAGRGIGKDAGIDIIHELAALLGASVAGTRPVIDWDALPFERQIGQTGKTVTPSLIVNCGISGANEYTAGIEKSRQVIAINIDPGARIFRFADLGIVGDLHQILPLLINRLTEIKGDQQKP